MTKCSNMAKGEEDLQALQESALKLNTKFLWRVCFRTEEPCKQAGYLRRSWVFCYYYLLFANGFLCGENCTPAQPPEHHSKD